MPSVTAPTIKDITVPSPQIPPCVANPSPHHQARIATDLFSVTLSLSFPEHHLNGITELVSVYFYFVLFLLNVYEHLKMFFVSLDHISSL